MVSCNFMPRKYNSLAVFSTAANPGPWMNESQGDRDSSGETVMS